jgi:uncharacterized protein (TIGR03435 family)
MGRRFGIAAFLLAATCVAQSFDVASIQLTAPDTPGPYIIYGGPGTSDPGRFRDPGLPMYVLLRLAFGVSLDRISGAPWLREQFYDITATMPPETTKAQFRLMLRNLLSERFHLEMHRETRNFPGYDLLVDKNGPKLKEVATHPRLPEDAVTADMPDIFPVSVSRADTPDGFPVEMGPRTLDRINRSAGIITTKYQERTIADFLSDLGPRIGFAEGRGIFDGYRQPILADKTGLQGVYTFVLSYYSQGYAATPDLAGGPDIFAAIRTQLGLRLEKTADVPADVIVIDRLDRIPSAN